MRCMILLGLAAAPALAWAGVRGPAAPLTTVRVTAMATVAQMPDRAYLEVGVRTESPHLQGAAAGNAARVSRVLAAVRHVAGRRAQLTTSNYSVAPQYQYFSDGRPPRLTGYIVNNDVRIRLDNLARVARVIDAATAAGANLERNLRFVLRDPQAARLRALARAAQHAHQAAATLARALNLRIVRIAAVQQTDVPGAAPRPPVFAQAMRLPASTTPIAWSAIRTTAGVTLTVVAAPR